MSALRLGLFPKMADIVPPARMGSVEIDHFEITPTTWQGFCVERISNGRYARLKINNATMMSDTDMELRTNYAAVRRAKGDVLIGGLGLGMIVLPILQKPDVTSVTVVELLPEVIALVQPPIVTAANGTGSKLTVHQGDIFTWRPTTQGRQFDAIYFDIWEGLCTDNVDEMKRLHLAFRRYLRKGGWVTSWEHKHLSPLKRQGRWR